MNTELPFFLSAFISDYGEEPEATDRSAVGYDNHICFNCVFHSDSCCHESTCCYVNGKELLYDSI